MAKPQATLIHWNCI